MSPSTLRGHLGQLHAARGGDVGHSRGQARRDRVQQIFDRRRRVVLPHQHRRMICIHGGDLLVLHLLHRAVETRQRGPVVGPDTHVLLARNWNFAISG